MLVIRLPLPSGAGGQAGTNDYTNQIFPAKVGLAKRPLNVVGPIGLPM